MPKSDAVAASLAEELAGRLERLLEPRDGRMGKVRRYLAGDHDLPYMPRNARQEFRALAEQSVTNWLPLVPDTFGKGLFVDGYRQARTSDNHPAWDFWQANGLDARQSIVHRGALAYGVAYSLVLPGDPAPLIRPLQPTRSYAEYGDLDDDFPTHGLYRVGSTPDGEGLFDLIDSEAVYRVVAGDAGKWRTEGHAEHGLGVTPLVRFRSSLEDDCAGVVWPLIRRQDAINLATFNLLIALQYASFRQRWATGLVVPVDEDEFLADGQPNPRFGQPIQPFEAAVNRLWTTDNPDARFGDFAQTEVSGHLQTIEQSVRTFAAIAQISPHVLMGDLVNLSADALAAAESSTVRKTGEYETLFGEAHELELALASQAAGLEVDPSAQVRWRDTESRSLAATVDAWGKAAQMLMIPVQELWEKLPGVTDTDVLRWKEAAGKEDGLAALAAELTRQASPAPTLLPGAEAPPAPALPAA